jgi:hypothetical protein
MHRVSSCGNRYPLFLLVCVLRKPCSNLGTNVLSRVDLLVGMPESSPPDRHNTPSSGAMGIGEAIRPMIASCHIMQSPPAYRLILPPPLAPKIALGCQARVGSNWPRFILPSRIPHED